MGKIIQVKVSREDVHKAVDAFINRKIAEICKNQDVEQQIKLEVDEAIVEITLPQYERRLMKIETFLRNKFRGDFNESI